MKRTRTLLLPCFYFLCLSFGIAQDVEEFSCGFDIIRTPNQALRIQSFDQQLRLYLANKGEAGKFLGLPYTVPIVVHIIHNGGPENIPDAQILAAIDHLNQGFAAQGYFAQQGATENTQIQFCLAKQDPDGNNTTGITRTQSPLTNLVMETDDIQAKNLSRWDPKEYINIWVVKEISSLSLGSAVAGYAFFPSSHGNPEDGMICEAKTFGIGPAEDAVLIHEMGHYFGLYHTFEGGCKNDDCNIDGDRVCDTAPDNATHTTCPFNSCATDVAPGSPFSTDVNDFTGDFMDYSPFSCFHYFTPGQSARMQGALETVRASLLNSKACIAPCTQPIVAAFTASPNPVPAGQAVVLANNSIGASSFSWFENGAVFSNNSQETRVFNSPGFYLIQLEASNGDANCTQSTSVYIKVDCPFAVDFSFSPTQPIAGETVVFTNLSSGGATSYEWFINGQPVANSANLSYVFPSQGNYWVSLQASSAFCSVEKRYLVSVAPICGQMAQNAKFGVAGGNLRVLKVLPLPDGSVLWAGSENGKPMLARVHEDSTVMWANTISTQSQFVDIRALPDGNFFAITNNIVLVKFDQSGNIIWRKSATTLGTINAFPSARVCAVAPDGSICFASNQSTSRFFTKIGQDGNWIWSTQVNNLFVSSAITGAERATDGSGDWLFTNTLNLLIRVSDSGNLLNVRHFVFPDPLFSTNYSGLFVHQDGGYSFMGNYPLIGSTLVIKTLIRFKADGAIIWAKKYLMADPDSKLEGAEYFPGNGWVGLQTDNTGNQVFRLDETGKFSWIQGIVSNGLSGGSFSAYKRGASIRFVSNINSAEAMFVSIPDAPTADIAQNCLLAPGSPENIVDIVVTHNDTIYPFFPITATFLNGNTVSFNSQWGKTGVCVVPIPCEEICGNTVDDDEDGLIDCFDTDCPCFAADTACLLDPPVHNFAAELAWQSATDEVGMATVPIVANLNPLQDSIPEIMMIAGLPNAVSVNISNKLLIFKGDGSNAANPNVLIVPQGMVANLPVHPTVADLDGNGIPEVILVTSDGKIRVYTGFNPVSVPCLQLWVVSDQALSSKNFRVYAADFDGDGIGELFCGNDVFKLDLSNPQAPLLTMALNGVGATGTFAGLPLEYAQSSGAADLLSPAECNGDPDCKGLEIAAGYHIYSIDLDPNDGDGLQIKIQRDLDLLDPMVTHNDGYTAVADLNLDGVPEVIVSGTRNNVAGGIYAWNKNGLVADFSTPSFTRMNGMVCIADVFDDKKAGFAQNFPELVVCFELGMMCFNQQKAQATPAQPFWWQLTTNDPSGVTGATVFDFNGDGLSEIVYRDQDNLRILYGGAAPFPSGVDAQRNWYKTVTGSGTLDEYPVVADLNNDGEAEIAVSGYTFSLFSTQNSDTRSRLRVFKSANLPWQPARAVWNQYNYFGLNINDDLSLPKYQQKHWLEMGGIGSGKHPFNTHLAQVSSFNPLVTNKIPAPDATLQIDSIRCQTDSFALTLNICNLGAANLPAGTPISFYNGNPTTTAAPLLFPPILLNQTLGLGICQTLNLTVPATYNTEIFAIVNDNGALPRPFSLQGNFPSTNQKECRYENNMGSFSMQLQTPTLDLGPDFSLCQNSVVTLSANPNFQKYRWQDGSTATNFTAFSPGKYWVDVYDACGFRQSDTVNIVLNSLAALNLSDELSICAGEQAVLSASGFSEYTWWPADSVDCPSCATVNILARDSVTLFLTATAGNCFVTDSVRINVNQKPTVILSTQTDTCGTNAHITANVTGNAPFGFLWSDTGVGPILSTTQAGTFTVEVTDSNGCQTSESATVDIIPNVFDISANTIEPACANGQTGTIDLTVNLGMLPLQFSWSNNATTEDISNAAAGTYTVLATDINGCTAAFSWTLTDPPGLVLDLQNSDPACAGTATGALDLSAAGGTGTLAFLWSNNASNEDLHNLQAGTYSLLATDANGCTATISGTLLDPPALALSLQNTNPICAGAGTGALDLSAGGGTGTLAFSWSNNASNEDLINLQAGAYTVLVTDANGCTSTIAGTLVDPPALALTLQNTDPICAGTATGTLDLSAGGGTGTLAFLWSNNASNEDLNNLQAGTYTVLATDANGCTATISATLIDPAALALSLQNANLNCPGDQTILDLTLNGGKPPFNFLWSTGETTEDIATNQPGTYTAIVTDFNGCTTSSIAAVLLLGSPPVLNLTSDTLTCDKISGIIGASSNLPNTTYLWEAAGGFSASLANPIILAAGVYSVTATEPSGGCTAVGAVVVAADTTLPTVMLQAHFLEIPCGMDTLSLSADGSSNGTNYTVSWVASGGGTILNGISTLHPSIGGAGFYTILVTDLLNGCTASDTIEVSPSIQITAQVIGDSVRCYGEENGAIHIISTLGGTAPLLYSVDNQNFKLEPVFENLPAGNYMVFIRDANNCLFSTTVAVAQPAPISIALTGDSIVLEGSLAHLQAMVSPANFIPAQILWSVDGANLAGNQFQQSLALYQNSIFQIEVADANGCSASDTWLVQIEEAHKIYVPNAISLGQSAGANAIFQVFGDSSVQEIASFAIFDRWGNQVFSKQRFQPNDASQGWDGAFRGQFVAPGVYVWVLEAVFTDGTSKVMKGDLTVLR
jgi:PKD repeat protein